MKNLTKIFLFIIWINQLFGVFGILMIDFDLFLSLSPISLIFTFLIIIYSNIKISYKSIFTIIFIFFLSIISELIGVNYGILFGSYYYGENLGYSVYGVPLVIGLNWVVLTISCGNIANYFFKKNKYLSIVFGSLLMLLLDVIMEQVSGNIDFWHFNDENLFFNYFTWFLLGIFNQYIYQSLNYTKNLVISVNVYISFVLFFLILHTYLNFFYE